MTDHYYTSETENVGQFRCETTFIPSNVTFSTDLPASFEGRAEFPSPGVLLGSTLASCMMSLVSVVAARKGVDLKGMRVLARAAESSKGIEKIELKVIMPLEGSHPLPRAAVERAVQLSHEKYCSASAMLEKTALSCPVRQALRPDLETPIEWEWK